MSHLGEKLSALIDGELDGTERDRAHAHLAGCERCRGEAAELRSLKQRLRSLTDDAPAETVVTSRLIAMTGPGGPLPDRRRLLRVTGSRSALRARVLRARQRGLRQRGLRVRALRVLRARTGRSPARPEGRPPRSARRRRYLALGTVSLVVGIGAAAFSAGGGGDAAPGPRITPPVEMYSVEHAITTGEIPFAGPSAEPVSSQAAAGVSPP